MVIGGRFLVSRSFRNGDQYQGECIEDHIKDGQGSYTWASGGIYEGQYTKDQRHGRGRFVSVRSAEEFSGEWRGNFRNGVGELRRGDGAVLKGMWVQDDLQKGVCEDPSGTIYEGTFRAGLRHGQGRLASPDGENYEGQFADDLYHGHGTVKFDNSNNSSSVRGFSGEFRFGVPHGHGCIDYANSDRYQGDVSGCSFARQGVGFHAAVDGEVYEGEWSKDCRDGHGICSGPDGSRYDGQWCAGQRHGSGRQEKCKQWIYEGPWEIDSRHGQGGTLKTMSGDHFCGNWHKDFLVGEGSYCNSRDRESYKGQFKKGRRHGMGHAVSKNGDTYDGQWIDGIISGEGTMQYVSSRSSFHGQLADGRPHGQGTLKVPEVETYEGSFCQGRKHGDGTCVSICSGEVYTGQWVEDCRFGDGESTTEGSLREYQGQWRNDVFDGQGSFQSKEFSHRGSWVNGKRHGVGQCDWVSGASYQGQWRDDLCDGSGIFRGVGHKGVLQQSDDSEQQTYEVYEGQWILGQREGQSKWIDGKGSTFQGSFVSGSLHGTGEVCLPSKDRYRGEWVNGRKHGKGVFVFWDGSRIEGEWQDDQLHGTGEHVSVAGTRTTRTYGHNTQVVARSGGSGGSKFETTFTGYRGDADHREGDGRSQQHDDRSFAEEEEEENVHPSPEQGLRSGVKKSTDCSRHSGSNTRAAASAMAARTAGASSVPALSVAKSCGRHDGDDGECDDGGNDVKQTPQMSKRWTSEHRVVIQPGLEQERLAELTAGDRSGVSASLLVKQECGEIVAEQGQRDTLESYLGTLESHLREDSGRGHIMQLARGLASDNWRLQQELAQARREIAELKCQRDRWRASRHPDIDESCKVDHNTYKQCLCFLGSLNFIDGLDLTCSRIEPVELYAHQRNLGF
mmetsp:Transcript_256/g.1101  ORF Transcript_256/g.1101 Transcript_256/m.1101 type:complete len:900 (-) Transcript_256:101-2800(-)